MTTTTQIPAAAKPAPVQAAPAAPKPSARAALQSLVLDMGLPLGSYYLMRAAHVPLVTALGLSSVLPAARTIYAIVKDRRVNGLAALIVAVNVVSIAITFWTGDPRLMLAKEAAISSTIGIAIMVSVLIRRPLMTAGLKPMLLRGDLARTAAFDKLSVTSPRFRRLEQLFSAVWGVILLTECVIRVIFAFTLPVGTMVWLGTVMTIGSITAGMITSGPLSHLMDRMIRAEAAR